MARISCVYYAAYAACVLLACVSCMVRVARQTTFFLFPILIIPVLDMESPQRDPRPPTLPTTIQEGPDATHDESAYPLLILCLDALKMSPELLCLRHPTISIHHPSLLVLTSCWNIHPGRPYLDVLGITLCTITTHREKIKKIAKCHIPYTPNYPILQHLSTSFTLALTLRIDTR